MVRLASLACSEQPVACIAQARQDVSLSVELPVECCAVNWDVGMLGFETPDSFGRSYETEKPDSGGARSLERGNGSSSTAPRREHRIENEEIPLGSITWNLEVVVDWLEGIVIPIETDMSNARRGNKAQNSLHHAEPRSKNRYKGQLFPADMPSIGRFEGCRDREWLEREVDGCFICHQHRNLVNELLENLCRSLAAAHYRQLVLNEWMPDNCECRKLLRALDHLSSGSPFRNRTEAAEESVHSPPLTYFHFMPA